MIRRLLDRRVPQFVALYVAGGWGFVQFVDWAVDEYLLAPALTTFVAVLLLLFIPTVMVIAWRHGAPGRDLWRRTDAAAIALNVAGAATVLFFAFRGQELGAMTTLRLIEDAEGDTVQRVVPKAEFRRRVLLYDLDNESGDPDLDWLENGFVQAVEVDLLQDVFVTPESSDVPTVRERLTEEGFAPGEKIPLAMKRAAAQQRGAGHFVDGTFTRDGDSLFVRTRLYETRTGRQVASRDYRTTGPLEVADRISFDLLAAGALSRASRHSGHDRPLPCGARPGRPGPRPARRGPRHMGRSRSRLRPCAGSARAAEKPASGRRIRRVAAGRAAG